MRKRFYGSGALLSKNDTQETISDMSDMVF